MPQPRTREACKSSCSPRPLVQLLRVGLDGHNNPEAVHLEDFVGAPCVALYRVKLHPFDDLGQLLRERLGQPFARVYPEAARASTRAILLGISIGIVRQP